MLEIFANKPCLGVSGYTIKLYEVSLAYCMDFQVGRSSVLVKSDASGSLKMDGQP